MPSLTDPVTPLDVSAVVCAYTMKRWDDLVRAVTSLEQQDAPLGQVVVVIDHNDELLRHARQRWPHLRVVASTGTRGLSGARDTGVAAASGSVVAFLDDDAAAAPDWSSALAAAYASGAVLGVGGYVEPVWVAGRPAWWPEEFDWVVGCSYRGLPSVRSEVRNAIGANMSLRRAVLDHIGGFDPRVGRLGEVPTGCEETELYIRARVQVPGGTVLFDPAVAVRHWVPASRGTFRYFLRRCWGEGISKRTVSRLAGPELALSSERAYVSRVLPSGVVRALRARRPAKAAAIVAGLVVTGAGYLRGASS
ncbi:glycosyltransferase family 2 protein [Kineococcus sp. NUM-3379]